MTAMLRTRIILILVCAVIVAIIFTLPKSVVENDNQLASSGADSVVAKRAVSPHRTMNATLAAMIASLRHRFEKGPANEKNAIFADSLATLYSQSGKFDSAAWFAEEASTFFKTPESLLKAGNTYYEAFSFAMDAGTQQALAQKTQQFYHQVLETDPHNLEVKTKLGMTYVGSPTPMQGIQLLREVLAEDPKNESALFDMGMLAIQSGQYDRAIERLEPLLAVNPKHLQGRLLLGVAYMNKGDKAKAREQFEKVKKMDSDPSVQATADSYLKDLK
jgi:outer membrane protein